MSTKRGQGHLTSPDIAEELVRTMASAIGLVLAVPLTTALAVAVATADRHTPNTSTLKNTPRSSQTTLG